MGAPGAAQVTADVHMDSSTEVEVAAFCSAWPFVSIKLGDLTGQVTVMVHDLAVLDRLTAAVAEARSGLLRVTQDTDPREPEPCSS